MYQPHHAVRDGHRDARGHKGAMAGPQFDVDRAEQVDARIAVVGAAGHRQVAVEANDCQSRGHEA
jgi:hypothetical protein